MSAEQTVSTEVGAPARRRKLLFDAGSSVLQLAVASVTLFALYRYLLDLLGAESLGLWSLVLAVSSTVQIANLGLGSSLTKSVAEADAHDAGGTSLKIQTAVISTAVIAALVALLAYPAARAYLHFSLRGQLLAQAYEILPMALAAFWIAMISTVYQSALYGRQLIRHRNAVLIGESLCYFVLCVLLAPHLGLVGLLIARLLQNGITLLALTVLVRCHVASFPWLPYRWDRGVFRQLAGYAAKVQLISLLAMFADPLTKGLLGRYGSIGMVGYYEMANRLVQQLRAVLVSLNQITLPIFARANLSGEGKVRETFMTSYRLNYYLCVPAFCLLAVCAPIISQLWIGRYEPSFVSAAALLSCGWLLNTIALPAYFASLGTGELALNIISHVFLSIANLVLGVLLGNWLGGVGVVLSWSLALGSAGALLVSMYFRQASWSAADLIPRAHRPLTARCAIGLAVAFLIGSMARTDLDVGGFVITADSMSAAALAVSLGVVLLIVHAVWKSATRRQLTDWVTAALRAK